MEFIEAPAFSKVLPDYLNDEEYRRLQALLAANPLLGDVMPGTGGFQKLRWPDRRRGKGRRGGMRVIYYHFLSEQQIWLVTIYDKNEVSDLTSTEKNALKMAIETELGACKAKRPARRRK